MEPQWIVALVAVGGLPAFLIVHAFFTLVMGQKYDFPIRLRVMKGPRHCPRCGFRLDDRLSREPAQDHRH